jgi:hypothetical protein
MPSQLEKAYLAGFLDGDGSIYAQLKPNPTYRYGFQVAVYAVLFQSEQDRRQFEKICSLIGTGYLRVRKDGILEYIIGKTDALREFLQMIKPFAILKRRQIDLMLEILDMKVRVKDKKDFIKLAKLIDRFRELNYSKKREKRILTP